MTEYENILSLIESVDPADIAALDEIDAQVWFYLYGAKEYPNCTYIRRLEGRYLLIKYPDEETKREFAPFQYNPSVQQYTRSRDALKKIRPEGFTFHVDATAPELGITYVFLNDLEEFKGDLYKYHPYGEELSELSAIIQAIHYTRSQK